MNETNTKPDPNNPHGVKFPPDELYAFPLHIDIQTPSGITYATTPGMTLRDYFAGQALEGNIACLQPNAVPDVDAMAAWSYMVADAMLRARTK